MVEAGLLLSTICDINEDGFSHKCMCVCLVASVQFSRSVESDSLWPHELQHARPPCPSPTPGVHSDSRPSSWWCHPAISSSVVPFSSCPQSLPASESFPMSQLFTWGGQSIGVSASASVLPMNTNILCLVYCVFIRFTDKTLGKSRAKSAAQSTRRFLLGLY